MYLNDNFENQYRYEVLINEKTFAILLKEAHFVLDIQDRNLIIKDVWVKKELRKLGIWKNMLKLTIDLAKQHKFENIISLGQFRRPIANKVWKTISDKKSVKNKLSNKIDYFLEIK